MPPSSSQITLTAVNIEGLCFAIERKRVPKSSLIKCGGEAIGPFLELVHYNSSLDVPVKLSFESQVLSTLYEHLLSSSQSWMSNDEACAFLRTSDELSPDHLSWTKFGIAAQRAAAKAGFPSKAAAQLVGALGEMYSNIYAHSFSNHTGLVAFRSFPSRFEFVALDSGIGLLESLRMNTEFSRLDDHSTALQTALTEGNSRFGIQTGHGYGFRPIFVGLANLNGDLRFRSGNFALTMNGQQRALPTATIAEKFEIRGFFTSVSMFR